MSEESRSVADAMSAAKLDALISDVGELKVSMKELTKAVNRLALIEERQANTSDSLSRAFKEIEKHDGRIKTLEHDRPIQRQTTDIVQKATTFVLMAVLGAIVGMVVVKAPSNPVPTPPTATSR